MNDKKTQCMVFNHQDDVTIKTSTGAILEVVEDFKYLGCWTQSSSKDIYLFIYNIRRIARLFPTVHYTLNLRDAARNELERNMERRYDFRCRRKPKCSEKTCAGKYGSRTKFTYDSDPTGNRTRAALVKGTGTTAAPTCPPQRYQHQRYQHQRYQH